MSDGQMGLFKLEDREEQAAEIAPTFSFESYTGIYPETCVVDAKFDMLNYLGLGLADECGEVCGKLKKLMRDDGGHLTPERRQAVIKELGDVLWYWNAICCEMGVHPATVAVLNMTKLRSRKTRGTLHGDGDDR